MTLTEECIIALGVDAQILLDTQRDIIENEFFNNIKLTSWGEFDFEKIKFKKTIKNIGVCDISKHLKNQKFYIIWDDYTEPLILSSLNPITKNIWDVTAVSTNTWLMSEDKKCFVEIYHGERVSIAIL